MKKLLALALVLVTAMALTACQKKGPTTATVSIEGNPTTGYEWTYAMSEEGVLKEKSNEYKADSQPEGVVGSGGMYVWVFEAVKEGTVDVVFTYARSFAPEDNPQTATYTFTVDKNGAITDAKYTGTVEGLTAPALT